MIYLISAVLCSSAISIIMRLSSERVKARLSMLAANYFVCSLLGAGYTRFELLCPDVPGFSLTVWLGLISGVLFLGGFIFLQDNTRKNGVVLTSIFMKLGLLVPVTMSVLFFGEKPDMMQVAGFVLALVAILLINAKKDAQAKGFRAGLILLLLFGGGSDAMSKVYEYLGNEALSGQFLFYTFLTALVLCLALIMLKKERPGFADLMFGAIIGVPNFFTSKFLLASLGYLPAVVVYPSFCVATMMIVTLTGVLFFKERLSKLQWLAFVLVLVSLALLNT
ncbi:MAG: EamA family transporter [Oscillospiraceae bacterium]|nr:EamA family transporter [Oscillospiraceae bacterium]